MTLHDLGDIVLGKDEEAPKRLLSFRLLLVVRMQYQPLAPHTDAITMVSHSTP